MTFETKNDVLDWYERQPRTLSDDFLAAIPWNDVKRFPIDPQFIPCLKYMRDVETLTDMYYQELRRTPTGRDPAIRKFMERWGVEEETHGEVLNRFLCELGVETTADWKTDIRETVSNGYIFKAYLVSMLANLIGSRFTATHMTFGAVHEMTTAQAYRRLSEAAGHPVLSLILKAIIREESAHTQFYWHVAKLELGRSNSARRIARAVISNFYYPVGQGSRSKSETAYTISTLFGPGIETLENTVTGRLQLLPGFSGVTKVTDTINAICRSAPPEAVAA